MPISVFSLGQRKQKHHTKDLSFVSLGVCVCVCVFLLGTLCAVVALYCAVNNLEWVNGYVYGWLPSANTPTQNGSSLISFSAGYVCLFIFAFHFIYSLFFNRTHAQYISYASVFFVSLLRVPSTLTMNYFSSVAVFVFLLKPLFPHSRSEAFSTLIKCPNGKKRSAHVSERKTIFLQKIAEMCLRAFHPFSSATKKIGLSLTLAVLSQPLAGYRNRSKTHSNYSNNRT